jgi:hypothetical protein
MKRALTGAVVSRDIHAHEVRIDIPRSLVVRDLVGEVIQGDCLEALPLANGWSTHRRSRSRGNGQSLDELPAADFSILKILKADSNFKHGG